MPLCLFFILGSFDMVWYKTRWYGMEQWWYHHMVAAAQEAHNI